LSYYKVLQLLSLYVFSWASQASSGILGTSGYCR
jgi:hypothetical protein